MSRPPNTKVNSSEHDIYTRTDQEDIDSLASSQSPSSPLAPGDVPVSVTFDEDTNKIDAQPEHALDNTRNDPAILSVNDTSALLAVPNPDAALPFEQSDEWLLLPAFLAKPSSRISKDDIAFLTQKGAMKVPDPLLREEILRGYLLGVHPFMPMLDFDSFRDIVLGKREGCQVSLLLFQAVMFAGLHSLQPHTIHKLGFNSAKQAREVFFNRVRLLYEFDIEKDSIAILQSLILMSSWYGRWDDRKHTWHYTGLAYDVARNMGLHREPTARFASDKLRRFRRRLWWSLYIRDRLIALGTRRPMRIRDDDFNVQMLCLGDFEIEQEQDVNEQGLCLGTEQSTTIASMCVQLAQLCKCIGHVVSTQYTVLDSHDDIPYTMMVVSKRNPNNATELELCDAELNEWNAALTSNALIQDASTAVPQSCAGVHWSILHVTYLTAVNVLHRAQALRPSPESGDARNAQSLSKKKVKETARSLTKSMQTMFRHDQVRFLGPIGVTALVASSLSHMLDISSDDEDIRDASAFRLSQNLQVLSAVKEAYASADAAISFLATVTRRAGLLVPSHTATRLITTKGNERPDRHNANQLSSTTPGSQALDGHKSIRSHAYVQHKNQHATAQARNSAGYPSQLTIIDDTFAPNGLPMIFDTHSGYMMRDSILPTEQYSISDNSFAGVSSSDVPGTFYDWTDGADPGIDLDAMAFNHDFYSDTFQIM